MDLRKIEQKVDEIARKLVKDTDITIFDTMIMKENGEWYLRVYIEKKSGGVFIEDCVFLSRLLSDELDKIESSLPDGYLLEVSSSGEKPIRRPEEYDVLAGRNIRLKLYKSVNKKNEIEGRLIGRRANDLVVVVSGEEEMSIELKNISKARLALSVTEVPEDVN